VVDAGGKLVDVISTFDLRGILPVRAVAICTTVTVKTFVVFFMV